MRRRRLSATLSISLLLALSAWVLPAALRAEPAPVQLRVSAPVQLAIGDQAEFTATLLSADGEPVSGATVLLYERVAFMDLASREANVSGAVTGADGTAVIRYEARRKGARSLIVRFDGDRDHAAASVALQMSVVGDAQTYSVDPPPGIPGVNRFLVVGILAVVWGTMFIVASHVVAITRAAPQKGTQREEPA